MITERIAEDLENLIEKKLPKILSKSGLNLTMVSIGGKFNDEGILLEIGVLPEGVSPEQCRKFLVDREAEGRDVRALSDAEADEVDKMFDVRRSGLSTNKLRTLGSALRDKYVQGTVYLGKNGSYALIGFSVKRDAYVMYAIERSESVVVSAKALKKLRKS